MSKKYEKKIHITDNTTAGKLLNFVGYDKSVLEIGCASGVQSKQLRDVFRCKITGVEIDAVAAEQSKQYCDSLIVGDIENICLTECLGDATFDVILMADVLEHLQQPGAVLQKLKPFLTDKKSYVVISIPNIVHASVVYQMMQGVFRYSDFGLLDDTHIRFFTKQGIMELLDTSGFNIIELRRVLCDPLQTEIQVTINSPEDYRAMEYLLQHNPESLVYQYVIKASIRCDSDYRTATIDNVGDFEQMLNFNDCLMRKFSMKSRRSILTKLNACWKHFCASSKKEC